MQQSEVKIRLSGVTDRDVRDRGVFLPERVAQQTGTLSARFSFFLDFAYHQSAILRQMKARRSNILFPQQTV